MVEDGRITEISFTGSGCAISKSSASLMTSFIKGKTLDEAREYFETFHDLVTGEPVDDQQLDKLGKLAVFEGVQEFPARVKCASLSWHTLMTAIDNSDEIAKTE
jgi:nitrogen fixation NifU-like protein